MKLFNQLALPLLAQADSSIENESHNAINAPYEESIKMMEVFQSNPPKAILKSAGSKLEFTAGKGISLPTMFMARELKESVCADTQLIPEETCPDVRSQRYPTVDGSCNNRIDISRGKAFRPLKRLVPVNYDDGFGTLRKSVLEEELPLARTVSNVIQNPVPAKDAEINHMFTQWGQYIVHDLVHTPVVVTPKGDLDCNCENPSAECINLPIPEDDVQFQNGTKTCFSLPRSIPTPNSKCQFFNREQINQLSSFIDATTVYGVDNELLSDLRDPESDAGELKVNKKYTFEGHGANLPSASEMEKSKKKPRCPAALNVGMDSCPFAGDRRVNENAGLVGMHTLFLREHNRVARELKKVNPEWSSDTIFEETRLIINAMHQIITYKEYLPILLGPKFVDRYDLGITPDGYYYGYDATIDATISNVFTTAAFRFGHSMINDEFSRLSADWQNFEGTLPLRNSQFNPGSYMNDTANLLNPILRGLMEDPSFAMETTFPDSMRNFLFANGDKFGKDLLAINIQRGREHGLGTYNDYRTFFGMQRARDFSELKEIPAEMRERLRSVYAHVDDIDVYVGGLAETHVEGGLVGPTFAHIMALQFRELKAGDRFYFEHGACETIFTPLQLDELRKFSLSHLICSCTDTESIQRNPFFPVSETNQRVSCDDDEVKLDLSAWKESFVHTKSHEGFMDTGKWSEWFPPVSKPKSLDLDVINKERPDDVCLNSIASELRFVNSQPQIRFICPAGEILSNDFPPACMDRGRWTSWFDHSNPSGHDGDDIEELKVLNRERPGEICDNPLFMQAQSTNEVPARETGDVFAVFDPRRGLVCRGAHQVGNKCQDYRVRFFCPEGSIDPVMTLSKDLEDAINEEFLAWTDWFSADEPNENGDIEYLLAAREYMPSICAHPHAIEARAISDKKSAYETGDVFKVFNKDKGLVCQNSDQTDGQCDDYQVRYLCPTAIDMEDYFDEFENANVDAINEYRLEAGNAPATVARKLCHDHDLCCNENFALLRGMSRGI